MFKTNSDAASAPFFQIAFERNPPLAAALLPDLALLEAGADKESSRGEYLRAEGAKLLANALSSGRGAPRCVPRPAATSSAPPWLPVEAVSKQRREGRDGQARDACWRRSADYRRTRR